MSVKGLGEKKKRLLVFEWLKSQNFTIYYLQETHLTETKFNQWKSEWGGEIFCSGLKSNAEGTAILIHPNVSFKS